MSLLVERHGLKQLDEVHYEQRLGLRFERGKGPWDRKVHPAASGEPASIHFKGRLAVKTAGEKFAGPARFTVTRRRLIAMVESGMGSSGFGGKPDQVALLSVNRSDLGPPQVVKKLSGKTKRIEMRGLTEPFLIQVLHVGSFNQFLETMAPEYSERLGDERAAEIREEKLVKEDQEREAARAAEDEKRRVTAARFAQGNLQSATDRAGRLGLTAGVLDHRKTWRYKVAASPEECVKGFVGAFSGGGGLLLKAKWSIKRTSDGAVAIYEGRKGLAVVGTAFSQTAQSEQESAVGSEVRFEIQDRADGYTICAMWLASRGTRMGFTMDGRFFRPYMRAVEDELRKVDASLQLVKD